MVRLLRESGAVLSPMATASDMGMLDAIAPAIQPSNPALLADQRLRNEIITTEMGSRMPATLQQMRRTRLATFATKMIGMMDNTFDTRRSQFASSLSSPQTLLQELMAISYPLPSGEVTVGQMFQFLQRSITDPSIFPSQAAQDLLLHDIDLLQTGVVDTICCFENKSHDLSTEEALELRKRTVLVAAAFTFDIEFGHMVNHPRYKKARARYQAAVLAHQLADDLLDIDEDRRLCVGNVALAAANEFGEAAAVASLPTDRSSLDQRYKDVSLTAPLAYGLIRTMQQEQLVLAGAKTIESSRIPDNS